MGQNPTISFYAWRLHATNACSVTMVNSLVDSAAPISWQSPYLDQLEFTPNKLVPSVQHLDESAKFEVIIISVLTLQQFQDVCVLLVPHVNPDTLIVVESTGYVNLEPFVQLNFPKSNKMAVCSIMYESDIKRVPESNTFLHRMLGSDHRIYVGTSSEVAPGAMTNAKDSATFAKFYKMLQLVQEGLSGHISLLKLTNAREFMTYQWKLALPRIVLNPISVIFEEPYPQNLEKQILARPLITGLLNEVFKVIKKMDCKLVKGFENEANLLKNWLTYFPETSDNSSPLYTASNSLFYRFYHQQDIDVDLLLLQPILLGDDHGVRTPYLENLYSILCQLNKMNTDSSLFFARKAPGYDGKMKELDVITENLAKLRLEKQEADSSYQERLVLLKRVVGSIHQKKQAHDSVVKELEQKSSEHKAKLRDLESLRNEKEQILVDLDYRLKKKQWELEELSERVARAQNESQETSKRVQHPPQPQILPQQEQETQKNGREVVDQLKGKSVQVQDTPDLSDFADVAVYGAALNGEHPTTREPPTHAFVPPSQEHSLEGNQHPPVSEQDATYMRELDLQRREQALLERERCFDQARLNMQQNDYYNGNYNYPDNYYNGNSPGGYPGPQANGNGEFVGNGNRSQWHSHSLTNAQRPSNMQYDSYYDQKPPHGLPSNGLPQNALPPTLRSPQRFQQNGGQPYPNVNPNLPRQRLSSIPNSIRSNQDQMPNQINNQMNMQQHQYQTQPFAMNQMVVPQQMPPQMQSNGSQQHVMTQQMPNRMAQNPGPGFQPKKQNRRSAFADQTLNIDYGGRGGMPMPAASSGGPNSKPKHRSMMPGQMAAPTSPPMQHRKYVSGVPATQSNYLRPPGQNGSDSLTSKSNSSNVDESSKTSTPDSQINNRITIEVPVISEPTPRPLGALAPVKDDKKKKKGFLR